MDIVTTEGYPRPGIYFMPERDHYRRDAEQGELPITEEAGLSGPASSALLEPNVTPGGNHSWLQSG